MAHDYAPGPDSQCYWCGLPEKVGDHNRAPRCHKADPEPWAPWGIGAKFTTYCAHPAGHKGPCSWAKSSTVPISRNHTNNRRAA